MADEGDMAQELIDKDLDAVRKYNAIQVAKTDSIESTSGECDRCGEHMPRLIDYYGENVCCKCRDKWGMP